jgi:plastocyanin
MKKLTQITLGLLLLTQALFAAAQAREITLETKKINEAVHWTPEKIEVTQGEKIKFVIKHDLEGGFDFHGFFIPALNVSEQVNRHQPKTIEVTIPKDLKVGEYPIGCQFHPKHVRAILIVKAGSTVEKKY